MRYTEVRFYNFRNISNCILNIKSKHVLLVGKNAQGKTSFLEALYILSFASSFQTSKFEEIITFKEKECSLNATLVDEQDTLHTVHFHYQNAQKEIRINQTKISDRKELLYHNPTIIFSYNDYRIITGGHGERRIFFDQIECFKSVYYVDTLRKYKKVLSQRNRSLKERNFSILDTYNYQIAKYGLEIMKHRYQCVKECSQYAQDIFNNMSSNIQTLEFNYYPSWNIDDTMDTIIHRLECHTNDDLKNGYTSSGPHRDRILFSLNKKNAAIYASTGQVRVVALIVKVIQSIIVCNSLKKNPLLLFDDVLLELDNEREKGILSQLPPASQLFFTFLPHKETDLLNVKDIQTINVEDGILSPA